jgi:hypothetical protein
MVGARSLSSGARSRDPLALPTLQSNGITPRVPSRVALNGTDLPSYVMEPNARHPNNQGSLWNAKSWDQRNPYGVIS